MAHNPDAGLVDIPATDIGWIWRVGRPTWFMTGYDLSKLTEQEDRDQTHWMLIAWDPIQQKSVWGIRQDTFLNGGVLTTAGNLVVQGTEDSHIQFYAADRGKFLHDIFVGTGGVAPPSSYSVDGKQFIAVAVGWNGVKTAPVPLHASAPYSNAGRIIVLKLHGGTVPAAKRTPVPEFLSEDMQQPQQRVSKGASLYFTHCSMCHGNVGEAIFFSDLRRMSQATYQLFNASVLDGVLKNSGMASFSDLLDADDADAIRAIVVDWAQRSRRGDQTPMDPAGEQDGSALKGRSLGQ